MSADCLFCRIVAGEIPATIVRQTPTTVAFADINPMAPTHVVVVPRAHQATMAELLAADPVVAADVFATAVAVAEEAGVADSGYRLVVNTGADGGQTVHHVHCHLLGGRHLTWPPG